MVSSTQQTERIRRRKRAANGRRQKADRAKASTPSFPIHPEGYDPKAPDAKAPEKKADAS